jgi:hypothetical protein
LTINFWRPKGAASPREIHYTAEQLAQGVSRQPPHIRPQGQCEDATNVSFSVVDGARKRPGTRFEIGIAGSGGSGITTPCGNIRLHPIDRGETEQYVAVFGRYGLATPTTQCRVYDTVNSAWCTVTTSAAASSYLNFDSATADDIIPVTLSDTTFLINKLAKVATKRSDTYTTTATWRDYGVLISNTVADDTYHATTESGGGEIEGFFKYDVDGVTFPTFRFADATDIDDADPAGYYDDTGSSPQGFEIKFQKHAGTVPSGAWTAASRTLTEVGAFAGYTFVSGDLINITGGTGFTPGWYVIASKVSNDAITLVAAGGLAGADQVDVVTDGIAISVQCVRTAALLEDMYAVAQSFQDAFASAGVPNALVSWTQVSSNRGYFTITGPFRGAGTKVIAPTAPTSPVFDLSATGRAFDPSGGSATNGSGSGSLELDVADRWTRVAASNQADALIDELTMPVLLRRLTLGPATFEIVVGDWNARTSGDPDTNPSPSIFQKITSSGGISTNTLANPTVVTTDAAHGLTTGDLVQIVGSNSTPAIDGTRTVTVTGATTFTVPVNVTGAGTAGRWYEGGVGLADMCDVRGRLGLFAGDRMVASQAGDIFNFYIADFDDVVDSDPIDIIVGDANIGHALSFNGTVVAFCDNGRQYELDPTETLTPSTASFSPTTSHRTFDAVYGLKPKPIGAALYFTGPSTRSGILWEYIYDDLRAKSTASDVTKHIATMLPTQFRTFVVAANDNNAYILEENDRGLYVYQTFWNGGRKEQSAWGRWEFDGSYRIADIAAVGTDVVMLVERAPPATVSVASPGVVTLNNHGKINGDTVVIFGSTTTPTLDGTRTVTRIDDNTFTVAVNVTTAGTCRVCQGVYNLERFTTSQDASLPASLSMSEWAYPIHLDRQMALTGVHAAGTTTWTLPSNFNGLGSTINRVVLGPAFTSNSGKWLASTSTENDEVASTIGYTATTITASGDYSAGEVVLGRFFTETLELTRPFLRDPQGAVDFKTSILLRDITSVHAKAGSYTIRVAHTDRPVTYNLDTKYQPDAVMDEYGFHEAAALNDVENLEVSFTSVSPVPLVISGVQWIGDYAERWR